MLELGQCVVNSVAAFKYKNCIIYYGNKGEVEINLGSLNNFNNCFTKTVEDAIGLIDVYHIKRDINKALKEGKKVYWHNLNHSVSYLGDGSYTTVAPTGKVLTLDDGHFKNCFIVR